MRANSTGFKRDASTTYRHPQGRRHSIWPLADWFVRFFDVQKIGASHTRLPHMQRQATLFKLTLTMTMLCLAAACGEASEENNSPAQADMSMMEDMGVELAPSCPDAAQTSCSGSCVKLNEDVNNCGECGQACGFRGYCDEGSCGCLNGGTWCGPGLCMLTLNDSNHCGECNKKCPAGHYCEDGGCVEGGEIAEVVRLTNEARKIARQCGETSHNAVGPLQINAQLNLAAQGHSEDMYRRNFFEHENPDKESPTDRMRAAGYNGRTTGENIAMGQPTPKAVVDAWLNSPGHCRNIMNGSYTEIGIGFFKTGNKGPWWTQNFGAP